jgi:hypothetical protein
MPQIGQQDPSGNYVWNGNGWDVGPNVDMGWGRGVSGGNENAAAMGNVAQSYNPGQYDMGLDVAKSIAGAGGPAGSAASAYSGPAANVNSSNVQVSDVGGRQVFSAPGASPTAVSAPGAAGAGGGAPGSMTVTDGKWQYGDRTADGKWYWDGGYWRASDGSGRYSAGNNPPPAAGGAAGGGDPSATGYANGATRTASRDPSGSYLATNAFDKGWADKSTGWKAVSTSLGAGYLRPDGYIVNGSNTVIGYAEGGKAQAAPAVQTVSRTTAPAAAPAGGQQPPAAGNPRALPPAAAPPVGNGGPYTTPYPAAQAQPRSSFPDLFASLQAQLGKQIGSEAASQVPWQDRAAQYYQQNYGQMPAGTFGSITPLFRQANTFYPQDQFTQDQLRLGDMLRDPALMWNQPQQHRQWQQQAPDQRQAQQASAQTPAQQPSMFANATDGTGAPVSALGSGAQRQPTEGEAMQAQGPSQQQNGYTSMGLSPMGLPRYRAGTSYAPDSVNDQYAEALPNPNQINSRAWMRMPRSTQDFMKSAYADQGYADSDIEDQIREGLPKASARRNYGLVA